ncbi:MAG: biopolymer transporter ExbD [Bacteroidales bacterium]|nr:MAG: biopolymer transporter ExbD [Bacteroidales bacterium]
MDLRSRSKVSVAFSMAGMTDIVFLLLIFFMLTSTLIVDNALKLSLPQSTNQVSEKPVITVSITKDLEFYVEKTRVSVNELESVLKQRLDFRIEPTISLYADRAVPLEQVVKVMNIAKNNKYKLILATTPEE